MKIKATILSLIMAGSSFAYAATTTPTTHTTNATPTTTTRVAVVDVHAILEKLPQVQTMRTDLEKRFETEHNSLTTAQKTLQEKAEKLASNKAVMTKTAYQTQHTALQKEQHELQTKQATFQKKVFTAQDEAMKKVLGHITEVVSKIAAANNYDLVVPKNSTVYVATSYDITTQVQTAIASE